MSDEVVVDNVEPAAEAVVDNPTPTPAPAASEDWRTGLPEDLKVNKTFEKFSSVEALAGSYVNLERHLGQDRISMPESEEDWGQLYDKLGRPEENTNYTLDLPPEMADRLDGLGADENGWFKELAYNSGLNQTQAQALYEGYWGMMAGHSDTAAGIDQKEHDDGEMALKKEWLGDTDKNLQVANRQLQALSEDVFGDDTFIELLASKGLSNDPQMAKVLYHLGTQTMEDGTPVGVGDVSMTKDSVNMKISTLQKSKAYTNKNDPGHKAAVREMQGYFGALHPDEV